MGRRKKEPRNAHREKIAAAASVLFMEKGIRAASMDDIAKAAGYSKATLYVYFENKEEIISLLTLESMKKLYAYIASALETGETTKEQYRLICEGLVRYQEEFPFYFKTVLDKINIVFGTQSNLPEDEETYRIGEEINAKLREFLVSGIEKGDLRPDLELLPVIFQFWGMLSGLIQLAANKEEYLEKATALSKEQFLKSGFFMLYRSITKEAADER